MVDPPPAVDIADPHRRCRRPPSSPPADAPPSSLDGVPRAVEDLARVIAEQRGGGRAEDIAADYGRRRRLQSMVGSAYAELTRGGMESDGVDFARETRELRRRIRAERGKIAELLRIPLEEGGEEEGDSGSDVGDDRDGGGDRPTVVAPAAIATTVAAGGDGGESTTGDDGGDPFMESILLLRRETPKLETVVAKLLLRCGGHSSSSSSSSSSTTAAKEARGAVILGGGAGDDPSSSIVDVACDRRPRGGESTASGGGGGGGYRLASRIVQEGGEEIEIFEKCTAGAEL